MKSITKTQSEWREGWRPAAAAAIGYGTAGVVLNNTSSLFIQPIMAETGWSTSQTLIVPIIGISAMVVTPVIGKAIQRHGPRSILIAGLVGLAVSIGIFVSLPLSLPVYYGFGLVAGVFSAAVGLVPWNRAVVSWFRKSVGKALSLMGLTAGLSVAVLSPVMVNVISTSGWRAGYLLIALILILVSLPIVLWGIKIRPDAERSSSQVSEDATAVLDTTDPKSITTVRGAIRSADVWAIGIAFALVAVPVVGFISNMYPVLTTAGLEPTSAATVVSVFFVAAALGRVVSGLLLDVFPRYAVAVGFIVVGIAGAMLLGFGQPLSFAFALGGVIAFAAVSGGEVEMLSYFTLREMGERSFSVAFSVCVVMFTAAATGAPYLFSSFRDATGSYSGALMLGAVIFVGAILVFLWRATAIRHRMALGAFHKTIAAEPTKEVRAGQR
ncbi:putative MFS family arabinose efflux permease [Paenarthrobacter nitroguajacolicus]|uniref:MFS transporter n=1 Tax=Paenarthrobacter nitroguajacolicus TaxID=211146 RepID=UPI0028556943|nr:MFS transporter [Paenarthrobacter nitroguajacolicus]MDR6989183.1 putative MFS family arabinose efflux permease [Paenarthrobacter nitroguajacolicus]